MIANDNAPTPSLAEVRQALADRLTAAERVLDDIMRHDVALTEAVERDGVDGARKVLADLSRELVPRLRAALGLPANENFRVDRHG